MTIKHMILAAALMAAIPVPAAAQVEMGSIPMWNTIGMLNQMTLDDSLGTYDSEDEDEDGEAERTPSRRASRAAVSTQIRLGAPRMPAKMAQNYAAADRDQAQRVFGNMLTGYGQVARQLGVPDNDVAGAVAAFIAGSWMAYHDRDVADADFPVLVAQMREVLQATPDFVDAPLAEKQDLHEQLAILGTTMALTRAQLQQQPNPALSAHMKAAARSYLTGFLKADPDRMVIDGKGLSFTS
ncbi:hypothetical protein GRI97_04565 [Altererythrobacter xixiisoli]|uniref:Uncharacterized protein n=1 Tax=Croceibacterium xixiisoli TaxID=1476466 RepID=A0A6I4TQU0_9SPHN|nr:DUF6683 family protein [Croceibacterium xixiisoli]MXO98256.1 hypothetical protein [Croceibacterium xixiisoli]